MMDNIMNLMLNEQQEHGTLSENINCKSDILWYEISIKLKGMVSQEAYKMINEMANCLGDLLALYEEREYKTGVKDGIKLIDSIKRL